MGLKLKPEGVADDLVQGMREKKRMQANSRWLARSAGIVHRVTLMMKRTKNKTGIVASFLRIEVCSTHTDAIVAAFNREELLPIF